jgi:polar amino acid transport system permease protein
VDPLSKRLSEFPWWFLGLLLIAIWAFYLIFSDLNFREAFNWIIRGVHITVRVSIIAYAIALIFGLLAGLGRISNNVVIKNFSRLYVELVRGIPMLVLIFFIALVGVPAALNLFIAFGDFLSRIGLEGIGGAISSLENKAIPDELRAIIALSVTYGAFLAEIFRAGIQSIGRGQMEASRSLGMSTGQAMRYVILPQAIRNMLPALGNDFVAMVKDSSLVSLLGVRDMTQVTKVYTGSSFRFQEAYITLAVLYLTMTVILSLLVQAYERRLRRNE